MRFLGHLLAERGEKAEAETWMRRAADAGHPGAMNSLAILLTERGEKTEAETWIRRATEVGRTAH
ncbi:tetratricopeptide repeat protein [Nocardia stercoris]|uniref:Sel1 repeat family protein n=1 Tax=Nocardia stercoris TaxID=2483361 RepID=A0A3M2KV32_9NOCA|nr:hypothetical protein EBN03_28760 [Nocardia stercoris]